MQYLSKRRITSTQIATLKTYLSAMISKTSTSAQKPRERQLNAVAKVLFFLHYDLFVQTTITVPVLTVISARN